MLGAVAGTLFQGAKRRARSIPAAALTSVGGSAECQSRNRGSAHVGVGPRFLFPGKAGNLDKPGCPDERLQALAGGAAVSQG